MEARHDLAAAESALADARREQRRVEGAVKDLSDRIAREDGRLYDGSVRNPKELGTLQHEVEGLEGHRGKLEDELIGLLDVSEEAERRRAAAAARVHELEERWRGQQESLRHESLRLHDAISRADARRELQKTKLAPRSL